MIMAMLDKRITRKSVHVILQNFERWAIVTLFLARPHVLLKNSK